MEIMRRMPWSRIRERNSVYKEFLEIVSNGKPTGNVWKETMAVSATIWISVEKLHHQIRLRILSCNRMSENHREPEVSEAGAPAEERLNGLAKITKEDLAITHFVKNGTLQNAFSTRTRMVAVLRKSAHSHTVRLMNSRQKKGLKRMMTKVQWLFWRKVIGENEDLLPTKVTIDRGNLVRGVIKIWDKIHLNAKHCKYNTSCTWNSRTYFWYTKATEHCAQPQAHSHLHSDQCYQLHERHDSHRRDNRAPLSTMRAVCRWVTHTVTLAQVSISSMVIVMRMVVWALV